MRAADGEALVRIHQVNTRKLIHARFPVRDGRAEIRGDFAIAGVAGTGARIRLDFLSPGGSQCAGLLPTGNAVDMLDIPGFGPLRASLVDAANPAVFVAASDLGLTGAESAGCDRGARRPDGAARPHPPDRRRRHGPRRDRGRGQPRQPARRAGRRPDRGAHPGRQRAGPGRRTT